ncbi:MAG: hypothetical protein EAZ40_05530 [Rhodobacterales bacterium]|nr:MAG: hypothetical protein EAZ40_05530 [Rhodobacterales bacterium]
MTPSQIVALCAGLSLFSGVALAETAGDPLAEGRVLELSFGLVAPLNTLQDTLTTLNGGGAQLQSTSVLDFGTGGRVGLAYSNPWGENARFVVNLTGARASGTARVEVGDIRATFPGIYDDGFSLPADTYFDGTVETETTMLSVGKEWARGENWRFSAGLQGGTASQDFSVQLYGRPPLALFDGELFSTVDSRSRNRFAGVYGGVSHYSSLDDGFGLRLSGTLGILHNDFDFEYNRVNRAIGSPPNSQRVTASGAGTAISAKLSARLERSLASGGLLSLEVGYEGLSGVGNGVDTLLDPDGTATVAHVDRDSIGASYVSIGYAFRY